MSKKRIKKRFPVLLKIGMVFLILLILEVIQENPIEGQNSLWNKPVIAKAAEQTDKQTAAAREKTGTFTVGEFTFAAVNTDEKTACITGMKPNDDTTGLIIPETVINNGTTYTVTDINFDNKTVQYEKVKTIQIPASVIGTIVITSTNLTVLPDEADTAACPYRVPFPNLEKVIFLGTTAPRSIDIVSYLSYNDMIYDVPSGSEAAYAAVSQKSFLQPILSHYDWDGDHTYKNYAVAPIIVSDTCTNPEPHIFQTENGVYIVTDSASDGKGTAALLKCKELVGKYTYITPDSGNFVYPEWDDYTIESEAVFGSYQYTVTSMESGALLDFRNITMLTIPDTITEMKEDSIYAGNYLNFVFFSKNCKTISSSIFNSGENGAQNGVLFYVPDGVTEMEGTFNSFHLNKLYLPKGIRAPKNMAKVCEIIVYYKETDSDDLENEIKINSSKLSASIGSTKKINATDSNSKIKDTIHFICMDPSVAEVSDDGVITPKHKGTAYVLVFSEVTGAHQLVQVNVVNTTFKKGTFTYRINYSKKPEVTVISCNPAASVKVLNIPSSVEYNGKKYTVTQVCAGDYVIDEENWWAYTSEAGFPRRYDTVEPFISDKNAKGCNITKIVFPSTIKRTVSNLGHLTKLKKIVFKGTKAPALIAFSEQNYNTATVYMPAKALTAYKKAPWKWTEGEYEYYGSYKKDSIIKLKSY